MKEFFSKKVIVLVVASILFGCGGNDDDSSNVPNPPSDEAPPSPPGDGTDPSHPPVQPGIPPEGFPTPDVSMIKEGRITFAGKLLKGMPGVDSGLVCNGQSIDERGLFTYRDVDSSVQCSYGVIELVNQPVAIAQPKLGQNNTVETFDAAHNLDSDAKKEFAAKLLGHIDQCPADTATICLVATQSASIEDYYGSTEADADHITDEVQTDVVDKAPSSHVDNTIVPAVSPDTSTDLNNPDAFLSANAESAYEYHPPAEVQAPTRGQLTDGLGRPLAGVAYYTASSRGITDIDGMMEYRWGETITFGIDTFTFGEVKGNQVSYKLTDVSDNLTVKQNIQALIERYGRVNDDAIVFESKVAEVFSQYPNAINEILKLNLPNGSKIEDTNFVTPDEFFAQFEEGQLQQIDEQLAKNSHPRIYSEAHFQQPRSQTLTDLTKLYDGVDQFHIFHNLGGYYGASGYAGLWRNLNMSNRAFPILMPRTDKNFWQNVGQERAYDVFGLPYVLDATLIDPNSTVQMARPPLVAASNISFNLPGITMGKIGKGNVVFMGNALYPAVLSCPDSFWGAHSLNIAQGQCVFDKGNSDPTASPMYDNGSMERFMRNLFTLLNPAYQHGTTPVSIATNIARVIKFQPGGQDSGDLNRLRFDFFIDNRFNVELTQLSSGGYGDLDPQTTPILLLQSYDVLSIGDYNDWDVISDISKPKLATDDVMALINYVDRGGHIIFMDAIREINPEPIALLADAAGVSLGGGNPAEQTTRQAFCTDLDTNMAGYWCEPRDGELAPKPTFHGSTEQDLVVYEYIPANELTPEFVTLNQDGTLTWLKRPKPAVAQYDIDTVDGDGKPIKMKKNAFFQLVMISKKPQPLLKFRRNFHKLKYVVTRILMKSAVSRCVAVIKC